jgi:membrane associated rhomboid family serine protease
MKTFIDKFNEISTVTKTITIVCIFFYLLGIFSLIVNPMIIGGFSLDISGFSFSTIYEVFTYPFVHSIHPLHLMSNLALLILFGSDFEKEIGIKNFILLFVFGWLSNFLPMMFLGINGEIMGLSGIINSIIFSNIIISKNTHFSIKFLGLVYIVDSILNVIQGDFLKDMTIFGHALGIIGGSLFMIIYKQKK